MYTTGTVLKDLSRDSLELEKIQNGYLQASDDIKTIFFYEEYSTPIQWGLSKMVSSNKLWFSTLLIGKKIVPRYLATIPGDLNAEVVVLHADHIQMVKFDGSGDSDYVRVARYLVGLVEDAPTKVEQNWIREGGHRSV